MMKDHIKTGVAQGRVLSPVIFSIYRADMPIIEQIHVSTYAYDIAIMESNEC